MKIVYVQPAELFGGAERQGTLAIRHLKKYGINVLAFIGQSEKLRRSLEEIGVVNYIVCSDIPEELDGPHPYREWLGWCFKSVIRWRRATAQLEGAAREFGAELIFASRSPGWTVAGPVAQWLKVPLVWRCGSRPATTNHRFWLHILAKLYPPKALVCNSQAVASSITPIVHVPSTTVPNAVDTTKFDPQHADAEYRRQLGVGEDPVVGIAARPHPFKGFEGLANLVRHLRRKIPQVRFLVAGESKWRPHFERHLALQAVAENVHFLGYLHNIECFYKSCDVIVLLSQKRSIEGLPNALLEAMAMERPVVATRFGGTMEMLSHGIDGFLVDYEDYQSFSEYICRLLFNPELALAMGRAGRRTAQARFSVDKMACALAATLRKVRLENAVHQRSCSDRGLFPNTEFEKEWYR